MIEVKRKPNESSRVKTKRLVEQIKQDDSDYSWYPTTQLMMDVIKSHMDKVRASDPYSRNDEPSLLEIGAGDGRVLEYLTKGRKYAIEKSKPLIQAMHRSISIVGTDFEHQTLIDKSVNVIFSNPPYENYVAWFEKILKEANCSSIYLIIPKRWRDNPTLSDLLKYRFAEVESLGEYDFLTADRAARAKVEIICISVHVEDPFALWFEENFKIEINTDSSSKFDWERTTKDKAKERIHSQLVKGRDIVSVLEELYQRDLSHLMSNYKAIETLDPSVLKELDVNTRGLMDALKQKIEGLKDIYWNELFDNLAKITSRLCTDTRKMMVSELMRHVHVDFTASNAHAILIYILKNANQYYDDQLVSLVEDVTEKANFKLYKSNMKVYKFENWRYNHCPEKIERYGLEYRIVLHHSGGIHIDDYWARGKEEHRGLSERAFNRLSDICTVANNLGFNTTDCASINEFQFESNKAIEFEYLDSKTQSRKTLMQVRAFKNGNMHIKFDQTFIKRLNIEFGRLRGWLKSKQEACDEMDITVEEAERSFNANIQLGGDNLVKLLSN